MPSALGDGIEHLAAGMEPDAPKLGSMSLPPSAAMRPMKTIVHISDLHFCMTDPALVEVLREELNGAPPDLVAISGDLTMRARSREYRAARAFIDSLRAPVLAVPGNHDITSYWLLERFSDPAKRWRRFIGEDPEPVWADDQIAVIGVDTTSRAGAILDWSQGRMGRSKLDRALRRLRELPDSLFRIVVAHHPFLPPPSAPSTRLVRGAAPALAAFAAAGVRLVLSGHLHQAYARSFEPVTGGAHHALEMSGEGNSLVIVHAATTTSTRRRGEPNAYNRIRIVDGQAHVDLRIWDGRGWTSIEPCA